MCFIQNFLCLLETEIEFPPFSGVLLKFFFFTNEHVHNKVLKEKEKNRFP